MFNRLLAVRTLQNLFFFIPVVVIYAREIGIGLGQLLLIESCFTLLICFIDLPLGHLTDKLSAKKALILGTLLQAVASFLLFFFPTPLTFWSTQILFAFAIGVSRGSDSALNLALLKQQSKENRFSIFESKYMRTLLVAESFAFILGGLSATVDIKLPFLLTGGSQILAGLLALKLPDLKTESESDLSWRQKISYFKEIISSSKGHRRTIVSLIFIGTSFTTLLYLAPLAMENKGASLGEIGFIFAGASMLAAVSSKLMSVRKFSQNVILALGIFGFLSFFGPWSVLVAVGYMLIKMTLTEIYPLFKQRLSEEYKELGYVTVMSFFGTSISIGFALASPILGLFGDLLGLQFLLSICFVLFIVGAVLMSKNGQKAQQPSAVLELQ